MQVIPKWRNVLILKNSLIQSTRIVSSTQSPNTHLSSFHSTSICSEKWKNKWNSDFGGSQQPTKNYIRYETRQKRADSKKALKNLLFYGASGNSFENESSTINDRWDMDRDDRSEKKSEYKSAARLRDRSRRRMRKFVLSFHNWVSAFNENSYITLKKYQCVSTFGPLLEILKFQM
uniref:Heat shock protein binding protein n=1 Tax=Solanum tuberosum TaxID=4113 RepID=M0ZXM7_SOLTU